MLTPTLGSVIKSDYAALVALMGRKLQDHSLAEDLINQAFVKALDKLAAGRVANPNQLSGYVYRVAFNLLRNHRRCMDNRDDLRVSPEVADQVSGGESPYEQVFAASVRQQVREVLAEMPVTRDREVLRRFYLEEDNKEKICHDLSLTFRQFDKISFRARNRMRAIFQRRGVGHRDLVLDWNDPERAST
jgi:RNA polymerase sigma-70 factor (ECF subfamily)